jgi:hypothetical protein
MEYTRQTSIAILQSTGPILFSAFQSRRELQVCMSIFTVLTMHVNSVQNQFYRLISAFTQAKKRKAQHTHGIASKIMQIAPRTNKRQQTSAER